MVELHREHSRSTRLNMRAVGFAVGFPYARLETSEAARRFPQIAFSGVRWALWEERDGFLLARQACAAAVEALVAAGGDYRMLRVEPGAIAAARMEPLRLSDGASLRADAYVFACGPWLGSLFPDAIGERISPSRQKVFFFGAPPGDARFEPPAMPVWVEVGERLFYGIPGQRAARDEYRLAIAPVVLGIGTPLFGRNLNRKSLTLLESRPLSSGAVVLRYAPMGAG